MGRSPLGAKPHKREEGGRAGRDGKRGRGRGRGKKKKKKRAAGDTIIIAGVRGSSLDK